MEKEEQKWEQPAMEEEEEEEEQESTLVVRKSRNANGIKATEIAEVDDGEVTTNGVSESNGLSENEAESSDLPANPENEQKIENEAESSDLPANPENEQKIETPLEVVLENEPAAINGEQKIEKQLEGVLESEPEAINAEQKIEKQLEGVLESEPEAINAEQKIEKQLEGVLESEPEAINAEQKIEKQLEGVLENEPAAINGEQKKEALVFFDKVEGIWKCRICTWTYRNGSGRVDHIHNHEGLMHKLMTVKTLNFESEGDDPTRINFEASQISSLEDKPSHNKSSDEIESADVDLIDNDDLEVAELDVERVIKKQNTHDLYCPNCNSCITRRVILRKRKRRVRTSDEEAKRNKTENVVGSTLGKDSVQSHGDHVHDEDTADNIDAQIPTVNEVERESGPEVFRCLSCFSFFIPTGNGFKLFRKFGDRSRNEKLEEEQAPRAKKNWFTSMFASNKPEIAVEQGAPREVMSLGGETGQSSSSQNAASHSSASEKNVGPAGNNDSLVEGGDENNDSLSLVENLDFSKPKPSLNGILLNSAAGKLDTTWTETIDKDAIRLSTPAAELKASDVDGKLNISVSIPHAEQQEVRTTILTESFLDNKHESFSSTDHGEVYSTEQPQHIITKTKFDIHSGEPMKVENVSVLKGVPYAEGKDTVITIDSQPDGLSQTVQSISSLSETASLLQSSPQTTIVGRERTEEREERGIEVIKSIIYGGLIESITSLSIVSSAAAGGAGTLNILALGMANLIGGLFVICQNLHELKCECPIEPPAGTQIPNQSPITDRYKELLGRRQNFLLHAVVSVISYLVFGLVPPVTYAFSFRKTDDRQLKLLVTAAVSFVCIFWLAVGRAYVRRAPKPYLSSVFTFVVLGFIASGVSYAVGALAQRLLERLGLFGPGLENEVVGPAWASY
ncbi:vacuolar iron transporter (VIT) family protein [Striga asiatica]|uniref:Vacuolar iron transporter (VIT) family protein n=1 Tax=Striga asiatica TaxID=4170 RepID=A0A5A7QNX9_STRAF|nr:vacuolar iron transporter (VIT) family protein [Striga asiatica]